MATDSAREKALNDYRKRLLEHKENEARLKESEYIFQWWKYCSFESSFITTIKKQQFKIYSILLTHNTTSSIVKQHTLTLSNHSIHNTGTLRLTNGSPLTLIDSCKHSINLYHLSWCRKLEFSVQVKLTLLLSHSENHCNNATGDRVGLVVGSS